MLFGGLPVWANKVIVYGVLFGVKLLVVLLVVFLFFLLRSIVLHIKSRKEDAEASRMARYRKKIFRSTLGVVICMILLAIYLTPQPLVPEDTYLTNVKLTVGQNPQTALKNQTEMDEMSAILSKYACRRSLFAMHGWTSGEKDIVIDADNMAGGQHLGFVLTPEQEKYYTAGNVNFAYEIIDKDHSLLKELHEYFQTGVSLDEEEDNE